MGAREITRDQAIKLFHRDIRAIRFDDGVGYLSVLDLGTGDVLMHGVNPQLEGKPAADDIATKRPISELVIGAVRSSDEGVAHYMFPKPGQTAALRKIVAVGKFAPWGMVVYGGAYTDDLEATFNASLLEVGAVGGGILLITLLAAWLVTRDITRSLGGLKTSMDRLVKGDLAAAIPGTDRRDEVGGMAGAVLVFKGHMEKGQQMAAAQAQERERAAAELQAALVGMADKIEVDTTTVLQEVGTRTNAMTTTAEEMSASAARSGQLTQSATSAAAQALANAQTVASAAEQLTISIREIGSQAAQSTEVVGRAVAAGTEARGTIEVLNDQVARIGAVADMIGEIAAKTNLLALNATIEAARAGDAGKGFAVVASEVKALATQTARSTQEIAQHIGQVRSATSASVAAVVRIEQTIGEINAIAGSIAAAVEQQGAATAEIARNVTETASAAGEMTSRTTEASSEAEQTGKRAAAVRENADALNTAIEELRHSVIRVVRTSTTAADRRLTARHPVDIACRLTVPGHPVCTARISDISQGGTNVRGGPPLPSGTRGELLLDGVGFALPFSIRSTEADTLHLAFELDEATASRFRPALGRLTLGRAA